MAYNPIVVGQTTMAGSTPVVIASDQSSIPITASTLSIYGTVAVTGSVSVTGPLTDTQLRASAVDVNVVGGSPLIVVNAISSTAYNLLAAGFSATSAITSDYILDHIQFNFNTAQTRDISVFANDGTIIWSETGNTSLNLLLEDINKAYNANENFRITISQTAATCTADILAIIRQGDPLASQSPLSVVVQGVTDAGNNKSIASTPEGHLEVALHSPRNPFGSIHMESLYPIFQRDAVYGLNSGDIGSLITTESGSGAVSATNSSFHLALGTIIYSQASLQSRERLRYRPGQGTVCRFTAVFSSPTATSYQVIGLGHAEDGVYFGYKNNDFGILYSNRGVREIRTLSITTAATATETSYIVLNGVTNTVSINGNGQFAKTSYDISKSSYTGWKAEQAGSATVLFIRDSAGVANGTYSLTSTSAVGVFTQTKVGAAATETFYTQTSWNGDALQGTGESGFTIDPTKYNVYQINMQYLGAGVVTFLVETTSNDGNNAEWVTVHTMKLPNTLTETSFGNPSFPFTAAVYSAGSTSNLVCKVGSFAGFIEGQKVLQGNRFSYFNQLTTVGATNYQCLFSIRNTRVFGNRTNQSVINLLSITGAMKHTNPCTIYIFRNATLSGNPVFTQYATNSVSYYDSAATTCTINTNDQIIWTGSLGDTGNFEFQFMDSITIQPGETITVAAKASTGTPAYVIASVNTREDQ